MHFLALTPPLSQRERGPFGSHFSSPLALWERDRVRVHLWDDPGWSVSFETVS